MVGRPRFIQFSHPGAERGPRSGTAWARTRVSHARKFMQGAHRNRRRTQGAVREAIATVFAGASWQRCRTHFMRNLLTRVPKSAEALARPKPRRPTPASTAGSRSSRVRAGEAHDGSRDGLGNRVGRSFQATSQAIDRLVEAGVLRQVTVGRRNRAFEAPELIEAFTALERQLASPEGGTLVSEPIRSVPRRRR